MGNTIEVFTPTEINILKLLVEGKSNKEIANSLNVSLSTVKWHVQNILQKSKIRDRKLLIVEYYSILIKKSTNASIEDMHKLNEKFLKHKTS